MASSISIGKCSIPDPEGWSLKKNPGVLTMVTLQGSMWRTNEQTLAPRNIFLLKRPVETADDFEAVIRVNTFEPTGLYQQIGIVVYQDSNNFLKNTFEWRQDKDPQTCILVTTETAGEPGGGAESMTVDGPVWLSIRRRGQQYTLSHSNDGERFTSAHKKSWVPEKANEPLRIGVICKKGPSNRAPDIEATVEYFRLRIGRP